MSVIVLKVGNVDILLTKGFERQGFAVTNITGLSEYGENKLGVPGSNDVVIEGVILPGADPQSIRAYLYGSMNPYVMFILEAVHSTGTTFQALAKITSIKCDLSSFPASVTVTIFKQSGWYGAPTIKALTANGESDFLEGEFEFKSPATLEIQLMTFFSVDDLNHTTVVVGIGESGSITAELSRITSVIAPFTNGLGAGSVIRIETSLKYRATLILAGRSFDLPVLGNVLNGMVPVSTNPVLHLDETVPVGCSIRVLIKARETFLTI